jgi:hypothetical protein
MQDGAQALTLAVMLPWAHHYLELMDSSAIPVLCRVWRRINGGISGEQ